jgi:hypothetical protein
MREAKGRTGGYDESRLRERVEVLGPSVLLEVIRNSITAECLESLGVNWDERFGMLEAFVVREGHSKVHQHFKTTNGCNLGNWVHIQKSNEAGLAMHRKVRLAALPGWVWAESQISWDERLAELITYKETNGHVDVPTDPSNKLWVWVRKQRQSGVKGVLSQDRLQQLVEIGFNWDPRASQWEEMFNELLSYKVQYGHVNVPDDWPTPLGAWVGKQRSSKRQGKLSDDRFHLLVDVGFLWDANESRWEARYGELRAYKEKHGDVNISHDRNSELWRWVSTQRIFKKRGKLPADKIRRLDEVGFIWDLLDIQWESRFNELLAYNAVNGNSNVSQGSQAGLGAWVSTQRTAKKVGEISAERIRRLEEIGFEWVRAVTKSTQGKL